MEPPRQSFFIIYVNNLIHIASLLLWEVIFKHLL